MNLELSLGSPRSLDGNLSAFMMKGVGTHHALLKFAGFRFSKDSTFLSKAATTVVDLNLIQFLTGGQSFHVL